MVKFLSTSLVSLNLLGAANAWVPNNVGTPPPIIIEQINTALQNQDVESFTSIIQFPIESKTRRDAIFKAIKSPHDRGDPDTLARLTVNWFLLLTRDDADELDSWRFWESVIRDYPSQPLKEMVKYLSKEQLITKYSDKNLLHLACDYSRDEVALEMIDRLTPDELSIQNSLNETPLHIVAFHGLSYRGQGDANRIALELISRLDREHLTMKDNQGRTALHLAAMKQDSLPIVTALVEKLDSEDLSLADNYGNTALHEAISWGSYASHYPPVALKLIQVLNSQQLILKNNEGKTPLEMMVHKNFFGQQVGSKDYAGQKAIVRAIKKKLGAWF